MGIDIWVGAITTLTGAVAGGAISYVLSRQQLREARSQRKEEEKRDLQRRSEERRFQAYSSYLISARSCRNSVQAYYLHPDNRPTLNELDSSLQVATDASALVFLVTESEGTYRGCIDILEAIWKAQTTLHRITPVSDNDPWPELNNTFGQATRDFQNAARVELGVHGPAEPWVMINEKSHPDILAAYRMAHGQRAETPPADTRDSS